jgi:hypothetical protein
MKRIHEDLNHCQLVLKLSRSTHVHEQMLNSHLYTAML